MKSLRSILLLCLLSIFSGTTSAQTGEESRELFSTPLFKRGDNGYFCFRIPAIIRTPGGALLAFAEARKNSCSDTGKIDLVVRRSDDNGKSWGEMRIVWSDNQNVCGNPAPVVEQQTGRILLLSTWNLGSDTEKEIVTGTSQDTRRVFVLYSDDDGQSWSRPREITSDVKASSWSWYATGPCHAIQLYQKPYKGRIVVPTNHSQGNKTYSQVIYSDDAGESWQLGGIVFQPGGNESTVTELRNGDLLLNMRCVNRKESRSRAYAISHDGGESWEPMQYAPDLIEPVCQGSILNYSRSGKPSRTLLFSNPSSETKRVNMTVKRSTDSGKSWEEAVSVYSGPSAYSDMAILPNGDVALLYECGKKSPYETITLTILPARYFK